MRTGLLLASITLLGLLAVGVLRLARDPEPVRATLSVSEAMGTDTTGYRRAEAPRTFSFPRDHGPHPGFKTEWWYYTGNLATPEGRRFGFQLTFFRVAVAPPDAVPSSRASAWATDHLFMGHFTVTDAAEEAFHAFERFSRGAAGLAGARRAPFRVWLEDWSAEAAQEDGSAMHLRAAEGETAIDLRLEPLKPVVLQGEGGLDPKGPEPGNASYYYSITRLATTGSVTVEGRSYPVRGLSWLDREWGTSALGKDQVGWDWFSLQLDDGRDLMFYQLRRRDGGVSPFTNGVLVDEDGGTAPLGASDVRLEVLDRWTSPETGTVYPSAWRLQVPSARLDLRLRPLVPAQELDVTVRYWEGAVSAAGTSAGRPLEGHGYVELTGYE